MIYLYMPDNGICFMVFIQPSIWKGVIMSKEYTDRFTEASKELPEKSAFVCESCKKKYPKEEADKKGNTCCGRSMKELVEEGFGP